jgi:hypothetical protein
MSVASLTRFTVPLASDQSASAQGLLMPKLAYRFRVSFEQFGVSQPVTELTKQVMDFTRPTVQFGDIVIDVYNSKIKMLGKPEWQDVTVNLRDDATGAVSKLVSAQVQKQFDFLEQQSAVSGLDYKFTLEYDMLDGSNGTAQPIPLESWQLTGCFLSQVDWGAMDYKSNEPVMIALTIKYDNAIQTTLANGQTGFDQQPTPQGTKNSITG